MNEFTCVMQYADGNIQRKKCYPNSWRLYGVKLNGKRPIIVFLPIEMKRNRNFCNGMRFVLHPAQSKGVRFIG